MNTTGRRRRWPRLAAFALFVLAGMLAGLWFSLPRLVEWGARRGAASLGFEDVTVTVARADLSGLRVADVRLRKGGLEATLDRTAADYAVARLVSGELDNLVVDGLALTLDFTRPRRGLLPDAVTDLLAMFGGGGELVWPLGNLELKNCRLVLVLPGGPQTFTIEGTAARQADGRVAFDLRSQHPEQVLHVSGAVRTETLDGEITVERIELHPTFLLGLAEQLRLLSLPAGITLESGRVAIDGRVSLEAGVPKTFSARLRTPGLLVRQGELEATVDGLAIDAARGADGRLGALFAAEVAASNKTGAWSAGPVALDLALADGRVRGGAAVFPIKWGDRAKARLGIQIDAGVPQLGGEAGAKLTLALDEAAFGTRALAPARLEIDGWLDRVHLSATGLQLAQDTPAAVSRLDLTVRDPLGAKRAFEGEIVVDAHPAAMAYLPDGWKWLEPALPAEALRAGLRGTIEGADVVATVTLDSRLPRVRFASGETYFDCAPALRLELTGDAGGLAASASVEATAIDTNLGTFVPGVNAFKIGVEVPRLSFGALTGIAAGRLPKEDASVDLAASIARSESRGEGGLSLRYFGEAREWSSSGWLTLENLAGDWAGLRLETVRADLSFATERTPDDRLRAWAAGATAGVLVRDVLPRLEVNLGVTAASIDQPGVARAEWAGVWLKKPAAKPGTPPVSAAFGAHAGLVRTGPEIIEQPAVEVALAGPLGALDTNLKLHALVDGAPLDVAANVGLALDIEGGKVDGSGRFVLEPFSLQNSSIASRWAPSAAGVTLGATLAATGQVWSDGAGAWDGAAQVTLQGGQASQPAQRLRVEGIEARVNVDSLASLRMSPGQSLGFSRLAFGDVVVNAALVHFHTQAGDDLIVEDATAQLFGGRASAATFELLFPDPDVAVDLVFENLDASQVVRQLELFRGEMTGRLRGRLPVGLLAGRPILGEGYLELDPNYPARFAYDANGIFTTGLPGGKGVMDQMQRLPYELLEEGLGNLGLHGLRVELFQRDRPDTPIRVVLAGKSVTPRATVPIEIEMNVNGTVAEALNLLMRLIML